MKMFIAGSSISKFETVSKLNFLSSGYFKKIPLLAKNIFLHVQLLLQLIILLPNPNIFNTLFKSSIYLILESRDSLAGIVRSMQMEGTYKR